MEMAENLFREASLDRMHDLMWMGPVAFAFYLEAAVRYLESADSKGDSDAVNGFVGVLAFRTDDPPEIVRPIAGRIAGVCRTVVEHYEKYDLTPEIYGDLRPKLRSYENSFSMLAGKPPQA